MNKKMKITLSVVLITALVFMSACASTPSEQSSDPASGIVVTDMAERTLHFEEPVERVVALTSSCCEILYALGAGDTLVGRGEYCDYPPEALEVVSVQSGENTNIEQICSLGPQVVIMSAMAQTTKQIEALEKAGITVLVSDAQNIEETYQSILLIGAVVGKDQEARELVDRMKSRFEGLAARVPQTDEKSTVYFEVSPLEYGLWTGGSGTFMDEIANMLGLENVFSDVEGWAQISEEQVLQRNPDYIITVTMYFGDGPQPEEEIASLTGWQGLNAVKNGRIYAADSDEFTRPAPRLADAAELLFEVVYGDVVTP